jgi:hypothetical protein
MQVSAFVTKVRAARQTLKSDFNLSRRVRIYICSAHIFLEFLSHPLCTLSTTDAQSQLDNASTDDIMATEKLSSKSPTTNINCSFDQDDAVTLHVSHDEHAIFTHGNIISRRSDFFKAALKKKWTEGQTRIIKLPD